MYNKIRETTTQLFRFIPIGGLAVGTDFLVYILLIKALNFDPNLAKAVSFISGAIVAFFGNKYFTFRKDNNSWTGIILFVCVYCVSLVLNVWSNNIFLMYFENWNSIILISGFIVSTSISAITNFAGMKFLVFRGQNL